MTVLPIVVGAAAVLTDPTLAGVAAVVALLSIADGYWNVSAFAVLVVSGAITLFRTGMPAPTLPLRSRRRR